ncbi:DinB family protein [Streptomyces litchfieldiae]|uniref:DinB family protein n=1 Tax=Streptomyces litchfieldiae TaxID=3075543 RepID=A0ABU2MWF3_9ACTN|nr:DinB family protein [Streptomyces sp. DSM 44938]MDT0345981.1 DinB family protein [Streptomyces sp. DSM 44938]
MITEPPKTLGDPKDLLTAYLDYYRAVILEKLAGLDEDELRGSRLPTGWTPLQLVWHLAHVERRWLVWGLLGENVPDPWGDRGPDERWAVPEGMTAAEVFARFEEQCARSREIVAGAELTDVPPASSKRFEEGTPLPALSWILFHLLQEYARHAGHLDIVRELADGTVPEQPGA